MTDKPLPGRKHAAEAARQARLAREAAALRANLHRRKAQARAQADQPALPSPAIPSPAIPSDDPGPDRIELPRDPGKA